ncbi:hypothetical protein [Burkholderia stabilis]|uniref:hypothetical protein n=1 Tax=Burkholderia stabilis TaxID=95485 RepID=UPI0013CEF063|nr:hypothetical protein [Burkholderia stabilis]
MNIGRKTIRRVTVRHAPDVTHVNNPERSLDTAGIDANMAGQRVETRTGSRRDAYS